MPIVKLNLIVCRRVWLRNQLLNNTVYFEPDISGSGEQTIYSKHFCYNSPVVSHTKNI